MNKKHLLIPLILGLLIIGYALSQGESYESPEIEPVIDDNIKICFDVTVVVVSSGKEVQRSFCRNYPVDLLWKCKYTRYGVPIKCENTLRQEVKSDLRNWYRIRIPHEIKEKITLKDLTLTSISLEQYQNWVGCKYDFMSDDIVC